MEIERLRIQGGSGHFGAADCFGGVDCREVLAQQTWFLSFGPYALHPKRLLSDEGKRQRSTQDLAATFPF